MSIEDAIAVSKTMPNWDTVTGIIRPRLIVLNAWLQVIRDFGTEPGSLELANQYATVGWCAGVLIMHNVSNADAFEWARSNWK